MVELTISSDGKVVASSAENRAVSTRPEAELVAASSRTAQVAQIVAAARSAAEALGGRPIGSITTDIWRARTPDGVEDRGSESQLVNLVADSMLDGANASPYPADIALMIPGSVRGDLSYAASNGEGDGVVVYQEAAGVLPWQSSLVRSSITGAQLRQLLEQQWQPAGSRRPILHLGVAGMTFRYDSAAPLADPGDPRSAQRITEILIGGVPIDESARYLVIANKFLTDGGDNFTAFIGAQDVVDTGLLDTDALVQYIGANSPVVPDPRERAVDVVEDARGDVAVLVDSVTAHAGETVDVPVTVTSARAVAGPLSLGSSAAAMGWTVPAVGVAELAADRTTRATMTVAVPAGVADGVHDVPLRLTSPVFNHNPIPGGVEAVARVNVVSQTGPSPSVTPSVTPSEAIAGSTSPSDSSGAGGGGDQGVAAGLADTGWSAPFLAALAIGALGLAATVCAVRRRHGADR